jgi:hypothetical protein
MPNNMNPQAIAFVDGKIRPFADKFAQLYFDALQLKAEYDRRNLGVAILPVNNDPVGDPTNDGRPTVTGNLALGIINRASDIVTLLEASSYDKLISVLLVAPNP